MGLLTLAGFAYAPQLADLPDQKMWRIDRTSGYSGFQEAARGRGDLARIERWWEDILRIIGSLHTGAVRACDVIRMLSRAGRPTPLGDAIAHHGRIAKSLHILRLADEPGYRRQIKAQANLQEGRHALARKIFHGRSGQRYQRYQDGMEDQLGAVGLVLNAVVLFNTRYMDAAVNKLRADGFDARDEDVARLSPFMWQHINMLGRGTRSSCPSCPAGCARCANRTPPTTSDVVRRLVVVATILAWASALARAPERGMGAVTPAGAVTASRTRSAARRRARYAACRQAGRS